MKIEGWRAKWLVGFAYWLLRFWVFTLRFKLEDPSEVLPDIRKHPFIFTVWHNRLLLLPSIFRHFLPSCRAAALISASGDGDLIAPLVERFGYGTIRGSTSRKGASALLRLAEVFAEGTNLVITPDGPRGPAYELAQGVIFLAQKCNAAIVPTNLEFSSCWRVRSWDRFIVPRPFCQVRIILGAPLRIGATPTEEEFENQRVLLEDAMMNLVEQK